MARPPSAPPCRRCLFLLRPRPARSPLFPYTTLFRSVESLVAAGLEPWEALGSATWRGGELLGEPDAGVLREGGDRKSTRLNSSHRCISYAVFCLKKKKK